MDYKMLLVKMVEWNRMSELELVATICMLMTMSDGTIYDNNEDNMTKVCLNHNVSWEFGLYWNNKLIPREFYKELNQSYYKASWLILDINRHYRMSLHEVDIGWSTSYEIIM
ncbi:hypothetical protein RhiirC2_783905 [Rhizophagus irregularis]|uniref:Uncharacterized protein n=1 Tax=Rhizophagus irregularis TaxID=588596 RepID=A0A2N1MZT2_9GLOM|nr:hypothetical protein RhiirC2_783905 [Rhizophagus irregularis]